MTRLYEILGIPFGFVIALFYGLTGNYLLSIFCLTVIVRLCLLPSAISQQKGMAKQARLQPKLRRIQQKYAGDQRKIQEETQALYQREGTSAMTAGCLPMLIQLPIMLGLFQVNYHPFSMVLRLPTEVVTALKDAAAPFAEAGVYSLLRQRKTNPEMAKNPTMGCMMLFTPAMQIYFAFLFPISVGIYTIMSVSLSFVQMIVLNHIFAPKKVLAKVMVEETIYRRSKEENTKKVKAMQETDE